MIKENTVCLESKIVGSLRGRFLIPSYQRGYRWGKDEVTRLLDDIYSSGQCNYCLQPIVIRRKSGDCLEVIDGQQRLTTLYLIYNYMHIASCGFIDAPKFSLSYTTREKSEAFLSSMDLSRKEENVDFWFMCNAYEAIEAWFIQKDKKSTLTNINTYFDEHVKIIWYEVDESEDAIELFARLNTGKIPLTSAELVKAMFLSREKSPEMSREKQDEISLQWDNIEKGLHHDSLWYFLTNHSNTTYQTRIDLILDLITEKPKDCMEKYYTFFYFDRLRGAQGLEGIWQEIQHTFLILKDWFEDHELYHKIGYLVASETKRLHEIFSLSINKTKTHFKSSLDTMLKKSIAMDKNYAELSYEKEADRKRIRRLLFLFNVEAVRQNGEKTQWFPFDKFKFQKSGKVVWSLEHIHAQNSEGMKKQEEWKEWLRLHIPSIASFEEDQTDLLNEMEAARNKAQLERREFEHIQEKVLACFSSPGNAEYLHSIANLALLSTSDNSALSNAAFDVKRNAVVEMDKEGKYIPFCTKMIFLKYYTSSASNQLHFWGHPDRVAYVEAINRVLKNYLPDPIAIEHEVK